MKRGRPKSKEPLCRCGYLAHKLMAVGSKTHYWCVVCGPPEGVIVRADHMVARKEAA